MSWPSGVWFFFFTVIHTEEVWILLMALSEVGFFISQTCSVPNFSQWSHSSLDVLNDIISDFAQWDVHCIARWFGETVFFLFFFLACSRACADIIQRWWLNGAHAQRDSAIRLFSKDLRPKGWWWNVFQSGVLVLTAVQRACRYERRKEKRKKKTHSIAFKRARQKEKSSWQLQIKGFTQIYKNIQISRQWDE